MSAVIVESGRLSAPRLVRGAGRPGEKVCTAPHGSKRTPTEFAERGKKTNVVFGRHLPSLPPATTPWRHERKVGVASAEQACSTRPGGNFLDVPQALNGARAMSHVRALEVRSENSPDHSILLYQKPWHLPPSTRLLSLSRHPLRVTSPSVNTTIDASGVPEHSSSSYHCTLPNVATLQSSVGISAVAYTMLFGSTSLHHPAHTE
mmetsp:Transcript_82049/g.211436  ORF Transcript_82049/g.211436 Transcript_82049/m.211436 type:complete len:205 (+) Transcript_82049:121-735(+)